MFRFLLGLAFFVSTLAISLQAVEYHVMPRFWTAVGFCPAGRITHKDITQNLESAAVKLNLRLIAALPTGGVTHVRIHWLLELLGFVEYTQAGVPIYDFDRLDKYVDFLDEIGLAPVLELMANPGNVFRQNPTHNDFLWENFVQQVVKHYAIRLGAGKLTHWRFETWNEPDLPSYNRLNWNVDSYLEYVNSARRGLTSATRLYSNLRGPAGLFKEPNHHPLCWQLLAHCNANLTQCPIEELSYHRKGEGAAWQLLNATETLLSEIYKKYPNLKELPLVNGEADPMAIWSEPREFQADIRYAQRLVTIVLEHWHAKLAGGVLRKLSALSHDNAFLSYHPHEYTQRTLLAHFRINDTQPPHSQFIQKPVYAALGMLAKLGNYATDVRIIKLNSQLSVRFLNTTSVNAGGGANNYSYFSWLLTPLEQDEPQPMGTVEAPELHIRMETSLAYIIELLDGGKQTNPVEVWRSQGSPAYPNATVREAMRRSQVPRVYETATVDQLEKRDIVFDTSNLVFHGLPWLMQIRACGSAWPALRAPLQMTATRVTADEIYLTWREQANSTQCLKTYEIWYREPDDSNNTDWRTVSDGWHLPFPAFQYVADNASNSVNGFYKVRGIDLFNKAGPFSQAVEYYEL